MLVFSERDQDVLQSFFLLLDLGPAIALAFFEILVNARSEFLKGR